MRFVRESIRTPSVPRKKKSLINNVQLLHAEVLADCRPRQEVDESLGQRYTQAELVCTRAYLLMQSSSDGSIDTT